MTMETFIRGNTRMAYLLGWPVAHSLSPAMMTAAFRAAGATTAAYR